MLERPDHARGGFTLLEVVLAVGLLAIITGMVFGIARTSLALGNTIIASQSTEMEQQAFFDLLGRRFSTMPANARLELRSKDSGAQHLSELTLQNVPLAFTWGGQDRIAKAVRLTTVKRRSGFLDIVLSYYEDEIIEEPDSASSGSITDAKPFAEIVLLSDVALFEWRVWDGRSEDWEYEWEIPGRLPLQLELTMAVGAKGNEMRHVFWIPPKLSPEMMMQQLIQGGAPNPGNPGTGNNEGGDNSNDGNSSDGGANPRPRLPINPTRNDPR
jgi:type II secretory pathway pseudopilin PulG